MVEFPTELARWNLAVDGASGICLRSQNQRGVEGIPSILE
jgi:hypothetical protein